MIGKTASLALASLCCVLAASGALAKDGKSVYESTCFTCHQTGLIGAPKMGNADDWRPRLKAGKAALYHNARAGTAKGMPAKGGNTALSDEEVARAVDYMVAAAGRATKPALGGTSEKLASAAPLPAPAKGGASGQASVNSFNRLLRPPEKRNLSPMEDGIHDPANDSTAILQPPLQAFAGLPKANVGNGVDWVKALNESKITPRFDRSDPNAVAAVMDLNIVREVKGSMPNVVYPHKAHTQWLDCSNCHPDIFIPQKGANQISMAQILMGQKCGVCHGKVAFPISECRRCHSQKKEIPTKQLAAQSVPKEQKP